MKGHESGHKKSRFGTFALLFGSIAGCGYLIANNDTYTRWNTDAYCMLGTSFAYLAVILGPATLQGLMMVDYRQVPRRFISLLPRSKRLLTPLPFVITAMSAAGLTMQDDLNLWYLVPVMLALGISLTTVLIQSNAMALPLWNVKHFMQVSVVLVISGLTMGVAQLQAAATYHQAGTELKGI